MHIQREQSLIELNLQGFISSNWGEDCIPDKAVTATDQKGSAAFRSSNSNNTPYQGDSGQHTLGKDVPCIQIKTSSHPKDIGHTQST